MDDLTFWANARSLAAVEWSGSPLMPAVTAVRLNPKFGGSGVSYLFDHLVVFSPFGVLTNLY